MNLNLYGLAGQWLMVDLGISFADETLPGVEIVLPDPALHRRAPRGPARPRPDPRPRGPFRRHPLSLAAAALPDLVHAVHRRGAAPQARREPALKGVPVNVVAPGERFTVGPFDCALIQVTHSIPEANALALRTPLGNVLHTGDWKLDPAPLVGAADRRSTRSRRSATRACSRWSCDSTNILNPGTSGSEAEVRDSLMRADRPARPRGSC